MLFSARCGREPSRLLLSEWHDAERDVWLPNYSIISMQDSAEQVLICHAPESKGTTDQVNMPHDGMHHSHTNFVPDRDTDEIFRKTANYISRYRTPSLKEERAPQGQGGPSALRYTPMPVASGHAFGGVLHDMCCIHDIAGHRPNKVDVTC